MTDSKSKKNIKKKGHKQEATNTKKSWSKAEEATQKLAKRVAHGLKYSGTDERGTGETNQGSQSLSFSFYRLATSLIASMAPPTGLEGRQSLWRENDKDRKCEARFDT